MYTKKNGRMTFKSNRRSSFKRNNNFISKGRNKGNVSQQYNKYLKLAKDTFSAGDRIQAEYYFQFTDHYYRLLVELGINLEDQENVDSKEINTEALVAENKSENNLYDEEKLDNEKSDQQAEDQSIESLPFMSDPIKKRRRTSK